MSINFDKALGIHAQALALREKRSEVLASNLVNADTPGYKARDLDFSSVLKQNLPSSLNLERTQTNHIEPPQLTLGATALRGE
jgi:flagellar basal-body rod protein FlgB